eukprot:6683516-Pyramimonas_sp.AAC.1
MRTNQIFVLAAAAGRARARIAPSLCHPRPSTRNFRRPDWAPLRPRACLAALRSQGTDTRFARARA